MLGLLRWVLMINGENGYILNESGELSYLGFEGKEAEVLTSTRIMTDPVVFARGDASLAGWLALGNMHGEVVAVKPHYSVTFTEHGRILSPDIDFLNYGDPIVLDKDRQPLQKLTFTVTPDDGKAIFVAITQDGRLKSTLVESLHPGASSSSVLKKRSVLQKQQQSGELVTRPLVVPNLREPVEHLQLTPGGKFLFILAGP